MVNRFADRHNTGSSLNRLISFVVSFIIFFLTFCLCSLSDLQAQVVSAGNGDWLIAGTWDTDRVPAPDENVYINHTVTVTSGSTAEVHDLTINPGKKLVVEGTLIVNGNLTMNFSGSNVSELEMKPNSVVLVRGDVHLTNKVKLNLSSYFIVMGDLTKDGAVAQGDIVVNEASIYVFGAISTNTGLVLCNDYGGITQTNDLPCHAGDEADFRDNAANEIIPGDIVDLVGKNVANAIDVTAVYPAAICNAASGEIDYPNTDVTTDVAFVVEMVTNDPDFNPEWEFSFTLSSTTGETIDNVTDGTSPLTATSGIYTLTGIPATNGAGRVTIYLDVTGGLYMQEDVVLTITAAKELIQNTPDIDADDWTVTQIIKPVPSTSAISTN